MSGTSHFVLYYRECPSWGQECISNILYCEGAGEIFIRGSTLQDLMVVPPQTINFLIPHECETVL